MSMGQWRDCSGTHPRLRWQHMPCDGAPLIFACGAGCSNRGRPAGGGSGCMREGAHIPGLELAREGIIAAGGGACQDVVACLDKLLRLCTRMPSFRG